MTIYQQGHLKHKADTLEVAQRTPFPEDDEHLAQMAWAVLNPRRGVRHVATDKVADWPDIFTPPAADG